MRSRTGQEPQQYQHEGAALKQLAASTGIALLVKGQVLRDRMRMVFGTPVCTATSHKWSPLKYDEDLGFYQSCERCTRGDLLSPAHTG